MALPCECSCGKDVLPFCTGHGHQHSCPSASVGQPRWSRSDAAIRSDADNCLDPASSAYLWFKIVFNSVGYGLSISLSGVIFPIFALGVWHFSSAILIDSLLQSRYFPIQNLLACSSDALAQKFVFLGHAYPRPRFFVPITFSISTVLVSCVYSL